jgi:hypothetical protein
VNLHWKFSALKVKILTVFLIEKEFLMPIRFILTLGLLAGAAGCSRMPEQKTMTLVNAAAVDAPLLERVRAFAERELRIPVRTLERPRLAGKERFQALEKAAQRMQSEGDPILIVLAALPDDDRHLTVDPQSAVAVINVQPLHTDDAERFARRIERQVMRAAAFAVGLPPTPDPFCVTRDYRSLEDLDCMGRNFSPPWQGRFAEEAARRGLEPPESGERIFPK